MKSVSPLGPFLEYVNRLKFKNLFLLITVLLVLDILVPDTIPMLDEIILGIAAIILGNLKKERPRDNSETFIEGEVVNRGDADEKGS